MRSFDQRAERALRITLRRFAARFAALAVCCLVALSGLPSPAQSSPTPAQFTNLDGMLALREAHSALISRPSILIHQTSNVNLRSPISNLQSAAPCPGLNATTPISWFATDNAGNVDTSTEVDNYPTRTVVIAPGFQYDCAAKDTDIVVMVYNQAYGTDPAR
jgi:hypothetical protein